jgi:hypothetical protein
MSQMSTRNGRTMTLSTADTSPFTIKEHLIVSMWVHEKGQSGQRHDELRVHFALQFNKAALTEANIHKLEK